MSATIINEDIASKIEHVWTVHGVNFEAEVKLNDMNAGLSLDMQAQEAATQVIAAYKGRKNGIVIQLDAGETEATIGTTMIAHLKGTAPQEGFVPITHVLLANDGYYEDSRAMSRVFMLQMAAMREEQMKQETAMRKRVSELKNFEKLQKQLAKKPHKKGKKKGIDKSPTQC